MSKRKKSRNQKIITDLKRKLNLKISSAPIVAENKSFITGNHLKPLSFNQQINNTKDQKIDYFGTSYYLLKDISKTGILTGVIIFFQFSIFFILKNQIIRLPMLGF